MLPAHADARVVGVVGRDHWVDGYFAAVGGLDEPVDGHVRVDDVVAVYHRHDEVDQPLIQPRGHVQPRGLVCLACGVDPCPDLAGAPLASAHHGRDIPDPVCHHRRVLGHVLGLEVEGRAARGRGEVELQAVGLVVGRELLQHRVDVVAHFLVDVAAAAGLRVQRRVHSAVVAEPDACEEVHALLMGTVDEHRERVEPAVHEALHVVPHPPVGHLVERLDVCAESHAYLGGVEEAVAALDAVAEGVDGRACRLVHWTPRVLHRHGRLEYEQVVVPGVVEVDRALFHKSSILTAPTVMPSMSKSGAGPTLRNPSVSSRAMRSSSSTHAVA